MRDQASKLRQLVMGKVIADTRYYQPATLDSACDTHVLAVTSGKGGVGKTTLAVNLAILLAELPSRVLLVDADLGLANVDVMLGLDHGRHIGHLLLPNVWPEDVAADGPSGIKVISGGSGLRELADADQEDRMLILDKLSEYYRSYDYVVIDTSPGINSSVTDFLRTAHEVLLVTTTDPTSLSDAYAALKVITRHMPEKDPVMVVNSAGPAQAVQAMQALNQVSLKFLNRQCSRWHQIEQDTMVGRAMREGRPFARTYPRSPAALCMRQLANTLVCASTETLRL